MSRKLIVSAISTLIIAALSFGIFKKLANAKKDPPRKPVFVSQKYVKTQTVNLEDIQHQIFVRGRVLAKDRIELYSEVTGVLIQTNKPFKKGQKFSAGELLCKLDDSEQKMALIAEKNAFMNLLAQILPDIKIDYPQSFKSWENYLANFDVLKNIQDLPQVNSEKEKFFLAGRNVFTKFYEIKSKELMLSKFSIYAPFTGTVTEANVERGALVRAGQKMGSFTGVEKFELESSVSIYDLEFTELGATVELFSEDISGKWLGKINRIGGAIDRSTQSIPIFVDLESHNLKDGMFLKGYIQSRTIPNSFSINKEFVYDNEYVLLLRDSVIEIKPITILQRGERNYVITGLQNGDEVILQSIVGAYSGMKAKKIQE